MKLQRSACLISVVLALAAIGLPLTASKAGEESAVNPAGIWKVMYTPKPQSGFEPTLKLKLQGDKLNGTLSRQHGKEMAIEDGKFKRSEVSFTVTVVPVSGTGPNATAKYRGKISGDTIKGKVEEEWMGQTHTRDWEAKRVKE